MAPGPQKKTKKKRTHKKLAQNNVEAMTIAKGRVGVRVRVRVGVRVRVSGWVGVRVRVSGWVGVRVRVSGWSIQFIDLYDSGFGPHLLFFLCRGFLQIDFSEGFYKLILPRVSTN